MNIENLKSGSLSDSSDNLEILFLDTFSSQSIEDRAIDDNKKDFNVGLIQFSNPVIIYELRIIPLSTLVSAESLKGVRLGATIPSSFEVHFYVNDLKAKEAPTFLDIGSFSYKEHDRIIFKPHLHVPTDGLFLRGQFESLTIAVLGLVTDISSLVSKKQTEQSTNSCISPDEIKEIDDEINCSIFDKPIEIKEPDDLDEFIHAPNDDEIINEDNCYEFNKNSVNSKPDHYVPKEDVHSLSPSPDSFRIRSPSPHHNISTPKSNSSNSSKDKSKEKNKEFCTKSKYSSPANSISPTDYSVKSRITSPISYRKHLSSAERDRVELRSSSSHHRDRYNDDNKYYQRPTSKRSRDQSPEVAHRSSRYQNSRHSRPSRSRSKESLYGRTQYLRSVEKSKHGRHSRSRSISFERNNDTRSMHSDSRDDRSICSINSRTRSSGGHYELNDPHRDLSPKSSSSSKNLYSSSHRSRRSRSASPNRKRKYHSRYESYSPRLESPHTIRSPDHKKSRYSHLNVASPNSSASFNKNDNSIRSMSSSLSPKVSSKVVESISSTVTQEHVKNDILSPFNMSPHSSISNFSLKSLDQNNLDRIEISKSDNGNLNNTLNGSSNHENGSRNEIELFEPLSPSDDLSDLETDNILNNNENYEQISLSSDVDIENDNCEADVKLDDGQKGELLEIISSDEEYPDELNAALSSDNIDYAKNYLDIAGNKYEDDEVDNAFDISETLFDPFLVNQLKPLTFSFNSNNSTTFIDEKLFRSVVKMINDKFLTWYSVKVEELHPKDYINESWVKDVELLVGEIIKLTSPIFCSFDDSNNLITSEKDFERFISILVAITKDGLSFELAISQKQAFKVRHLKAGIKLFIALFSSLDLHSMHEKNNQQLLNALLEANLPHDLLLLYNKPYMTLSLRLLILNGLIVLCDFPKGVEYISNQKLDWRDTGSETIDVPVLHNDDSFEISQLTIYQYVLTLILHQQKSRLTSVFDELLDKIHLFESFKLLSKINTENLVQEYNDNSIKHDVFGMESQHEGNVYAMLVQLVTSFSRLSNRIHRPLRLLPNICQYEIKTAVHSSTSLSFLSSSEFGNYGHNPELFNFIKSRLVCRHISCSSSKIGFFSQKAFYRYFKYFDLLSLFVNILTIINDQLSSSAKTDQNNSNQYLFLCEIVLSLLDLVTSHQQGLKFFLEDDKNTNYANAIHKCLVNPKLNSVENGQIKDKLINFGVKFITRLYSLNLVDDILHNVFVSQPEIDNIQNLTLNSTVLNFYKNDNFQAIDRLFRLYTMIYLDRSIFRDSVVSILTMEHNFDAIISFLLPITSQFNPQKLSLINEKIPSLDSISFVYATKLAIACIQYLPEKNLIHFYDSYGQLLLKSIETVQSLVQNASVKLHKSDIYQNHIFQFASLANWLSPLKSGNFNSHDELSIRMFVTILKKHNDLCRDKFNSIDNYINRIFYFEPEIITSIKVLVSLCDPTSDYAKNQDPEIQLKYKYSLLHCYSYDCVSYLLTLLEAVSETCLRPSHQTYAYSCNDSYSNLFLKSFYKSNSSITLQKQHSLQQHSNSFLHQGTMILEFIRPSIRLLKLILNYLLTSVGSKFNDSTPIPILLSIYNLLDFYQLTVMKNDRLSQVEMGIKVISTLIQKEIIDIFLSVYTCVYVEHSESEDVLKKSVWTKMLKHVIDFTCSSPKHFSSGLDVLSKILPRPFPLRFSKKVNDVKIGNIINFRKLWSAHLHVLKSELEQMVNLLLLCDCPNVQKHLRDVCYKFCDLYSPTVITLTKSITEFLVHNLNVCLKLTKESEQEEIKEQQKHQYSTNCIKVLDLILDLFDRNVAFRIGILNAFYFYSNGEISRKESSKICQFVEKLFECLNERKLDSNINLSSLNLFKNILADDQFDTTKNETKDISVLINEYFDKSRNPLLSSSLHDKLNSKFISICSESLNDYFSKRSPYVNFVKSEDFSKSDKNASRQDGIQIYSPEFVQLFTSVNCFEPNLSMSSQREFRFNLNFEEIAKKYFDKDSISLSKAFEILYMPIVEIPEPQPEKPVEEVNKISNAPISTNKRISIRGRGRGFGGRLDLFRSRPPNTSRPPSMHVDDFVALEKRQDPHVSSKSRSSHLQLHVNSGLSHSSSSNSSSSYGGKHQMQDYIRKKNLSSHHSLHGHSHLSPYSNSLKSNLLSNNNNQSSNTTAHYSKQP